MDLLLETNFLVELIFEQEQASACEALLSAAERGNHTIHIPAFSLMEQVYRVIGSGKSRLSLQSAVEKELEEAARESGNKETLLQLGREFTTLLEERSQHQQERLLTLSQRISAVAQQVPLTPAVWARATHLAETIDLTLPDCIVCASLLERTTELGSDAENLFVTRDKKGFQQATVRQLFQDCGCEVLLSFEHTASRLRLG